MTECSRCQGSKRLYSDASDEFRTCSRCNGEGVDYKLLANELAESIISLAETAGIPDSFMAFDSRIVLARETLEATTEYRKALNG